MAISNLLTGSLCRLGLHNQRVSLPAVTVAPHLCQHSKRLLVRVRGSKQGVEQRLTWLEKNVLRVAVGKPLLSQEEAATAETEAADPHKTQEQRTDYLEAELCKLAKQQQSLLEVEPQSEGLLPDASADVSKAALHMVKSSDAKSSSRKASDPPVFDALALLATWDKRWYPVLHNAVIVWLPHVCGLAVSIDGIWLVLHPAEGEAFLQAGGLVVGGYFAVRCSLAVMNGLFELLADVQRANGGLKVKKLVNLPW